MNFCLNYDNNLYTTEKNTDYHDFTNVQDLYPNDYFTVNFDVNYDGTLYINSENNQSNQSAIVKQGLAIRDAINHVLNVTGKNKVILVGHSMGGLSAREYLQNSSIWIEPNVNHHVAKLLTIGTPHGGSNATNFGLPISEANVRSEAVRDLRTVYSLSQQEGAYLFSGAEDFNYINNLITNFYNVDVNCNGVIGEWVTGINQKPIPLNLSYSCIVGTGQLLPVSGDGVVTELSANINNFHPLNAQIFELPNLHTALTWHTELQKQYGGIMKGLDEPSTASLSSQAYEIFFRAVLLWINNTSEYH